MYGSSLHGQYRRDVPRKRVVDDQGEEQTDQ